MYFCSEENFLQFDAIYLFVSFLQSLIRSGCKMRVHVLRLFMISMYSFLTATIIICMLMVSISKETNHKLDTVACRGGWQVIQSCTIIALDFEGRVCRYGMVGLIKDLWCRSYDHIFIDT